MSDAPVLLPTADAAQTRRAARALLHPYRSTLLLALVVLLAIGWARRRFDIPDTI